MTRFRRSWMPFNAELWRVRLFCGMSGTHMRAYAVAAMRFEYKSMRPIFSYPAQFRNVGATYLAAAVALQYDTAPTVVNA